MTENTLPKKSVGNVNMPQWFYWIAGVPMLLIVGLAALYYVRFARCETSTYAPNTSTDELNLWCIFNGTPAEWGQIGDFFGGMLNPVIGLITIIFIVISIHQTQKALTQNQIALEQSNKALMQNEQALNDSKTELQISNAIMNEQKQLTDFSLKFDLIHRFISSINAVAEETREIPSIPGRSSKMVFNFNSSANKYIQEKCGDEMSHEETVHANFFHFAATKAIPTAYGLQTIFDYYRQAPQFQEIILLSIATQTKPSFLCAMAIHIMLDEHEVKTDFEKSPDTKLATTKLLTDALELSNNRYYLDRIAIIRNRNP